MDFRKLLFLLVLICTSCARQPKVKVIVELELVTGTVVTESFIINQKGKLFIDGYRGSYWLGCHGCETLMGISKNNSVIRYGAISFKEIKREKI